MPVKYRPKLKRVPLLPMPALPNWPDVVKGLITAGVPRTRISTNCRIARETIQAIADGETEPKFSQGQMLIRLKEYIEATHGSRN